MLLYYIRHGDPIYNPDSLTPLGLRQAEAVGRRLCLHGIDEVYVSSSMRARQTAQPLCEMLKLEPTVLDWAHESHAWEQMAIESNNGKRMWLFAHPDFTEALASNEARALGFKWYDHPAFKRYPCIEEGIKRVQNEVDNWLNGFGYAHDHEKNMYLNSTHNEKRIALFAHQGFGMAFLSCVLDIPYPVFATHFDIAHSSMTVIHFPENEGYCVPKAIQMSNDSHLYKENLPTKYSNRFYI